MKSDNIPHIQPFNKLKREWQVSAGGKGGALGRLYQAGYPVPDGFVILPAAFDGNELVNGAWGKVRDQLNQMREKNRDIAFAVRSSALAEDSAQASFAGEFETVLDVSTDREIYDAILTVRKSRLSERVQAYSQAKGMDFSHEIAIVIQQLVRADISGVLFTAEPVTGNRNKMTGNFIHGLGEKLVSGEVNAQEFTLQDSKRHYEGPLELKKHAKKLFKLGKRLEKELGLPQDIEWCIASGKLYLLQSRPITTTRNYNPATGELNITYTGDYLWTNVQSAAEYPDVMTPSTWSTWKILFDKLSLGENRRSFGYIAGRPYVNFSMVYSFMSKIYRNPEKVAEMIENMFAVPPDGVEVPEFPISFMTIFFKIIPQELRAELKKNKLKKKIPFFLESTAKHCFESRKKIKKIQNKEELSEFWLKDTKILLIDVFTLQDALNETFYMNINGLKKELAKLISKKDVNTLVSSLGSGTGNLASIGPIIGISQVKNGEITRDEYFERYGHRSPHENYLSKPRPYENPEWLDKELEEFDKSPFNVKELLQRRNEQFNAVWDDIAGKLPPKKVGSFKTKIEEINNACITREHVRSELTRVVGVIRDIFIRAGELTELGTDIFFLTVDELVEVLCGDDSATSYIPARRETHAKYSDLPPLPRWIRGRFDPFQWINDPDRSNEIYDPFLGEVSGVETSDTITGKPGSAGRVEGVVRRIDNPEDGNQLQSGEILVTFTTNVGWTPLFPRAAAVVTDVGAALSHAAIVAREIGIPAVVGCINATIRLKTGDRVIVDGGQGIVKILD
ncbi:MAG: PEP/pyruvate-binding domain-containing protein [Candidatus Odinarchaeota archaeon]